MQIEIDRFDLDFAGFDLGKIEDVIDDVEQRVGGFGREIGVALRASVMSVARSRSIMPTTPLSGVRISWLMRARNSLLAALAASAASLASSTCAACFRCVMSKAIPCKNAGRPSSSRMSGIRPAPRRCVHPAQKPILGPEIGPGGAGAGKFLDPALAVFGMQLVIPQDRIIEPFGLGESEHRFDLRTDVELLPRFIEAGHEGHDRELFHQRPITQVRLPAGGIRDGGGAGAGTPNLAGDRAGKAGEPFEDGLGIAGVDILEKDSALPAALTLFHEPVIPTGVSRPGATRAFSYIGESPILSQRKSRRFTSGPKELRRCLRLGTGNGPCRPITRSQGIAKREIRAAKRADLR